MSHSTLALYCWLTPGFVATSHSHIDCRGQYCYSSRLRIASCFAPVPPVTMAALLLRLIALAIVTLHAGTAASAASM
jgi:hypothetical protein